MCGIIGIQGIESHKELVEEGLKITKNRGQDDSSINSYKNFSLGHNLHAIISHIKQPFENKNHIFATNCEIYNWEKLKEKENIKANNDAELMLKLIEKKGIKAIEKFDGVFAFSLFDKKNEEIIIARDIIGVKPIFYSTNYKTKTGFAFASEKKALLKQGFENIKELNPRQILTYSIKTKKIKFTQRKFFDILPEHKDNHKDILKKLENKLIKAITKRIPDQIKSSKNIKKFGILFSGGIDSTIIAFICKKLGLKFTCYTAAIKDLGEEAQDLVMAKKIAKDLDLNLKIATITLKELEKYIKKVSPLIESNNVVKMGVALPFYIACEIAKKDKIKIIFSGLGSEEIFAGYERHAVSAGIKKDHSSYEKIEEAYKKLDLGNVNKECLSGLTQIHERDLYRDDVVTMYNNLELRLPFFDKDLIKYALKIPAKFKISKDEKKIILREVSENLGLKKEYARRPKKAAQYGSKFDKGIAKLAKLNGIKHKSEYLKQFFTEPNLKLGSLLSSGKDSLYAAYVMKKQNYDITCFLTIASENKHSFMFHTPTIELAKMQAKAAKIPILIQKTKGEKEKELKDLEILLKKAKEKYHIQGIISGALFSTYQRDRIEKICDKLGLVCFNPLWHKNQEEYMKEVIDQKFEFIMSAVMSYGLDKTWINKTITNKEIEKLISLNNKLGMNVAGEGGEFETFVLDCPLFKKKLVIKEFEILIDPEREENATLDIKKIELEEK